MHIYIDVCVCVCIYIYIYIYVCIIYNLFFTFRDRSRGVALHQLWIKIIYIISVSSTKKGGNNVAQ